MHKVDVMITEVKLDIYVPEEVVATIQHALHNIGIGIVGKYDHVMSYHCVKGRWRPLEGSNPHIGKAGEMTEAEEIKMELICPKEKLREAMDVIRRVHPYEEPVCHVIPLLDRSSF